LLSPVTYGERVTVDYKSPVPPHRQVAQFIRDRIRAGEFGPGDRIPGVTGLMQQYGIPPHHSWQGPRAAERGGCNHRRPRLGLLRQGI